MSGLFNLQPRVEIPAWFAFMVVGLAWFGRYCGRAFLVALHSQIYSSLSLVGLSAVIGHSVIAPWWPWLVLGVALVSIALRFVLDPAGVGQSVRGCRLSISKYRFGWFNASPGWRSTMNRCDVAKRGVPMPLLLSTRSTPYVDKLRVKIPAGLDPSAFLDYRADLLQWGWGAQAVRAFNPQPRHHNLELWNLINDPLLDPVEPFPQPDEALPKAGLPLFLQEDGTPWLWKVRGGAAHLFVCGISGSGKGSVIGSIIDATRKGTDEGLIELWGIDPQASELGMWRHRFKRLVYNQADAAVMLETLSKTMHRRTRHMFGRTRQHQPTPGDKLYVLIADEGLMLLDKTDRALYRRLISAFGDLTRGGRKASIVVVFLSQRAELDVVEIRKDFPNAIALQQRMESDVNMVLGRGALEAGAKAHEITLPGVAYAGTELGIVRGRFPRHDDNYIRSVPPAPGNEEPENLPAPPVEPDGFFGIA